MSNDESRPQPPGDQQREAAQRRRQQQAPAEQARPRADQLSANEKKVLAYLIQENNLARRTPPVIASAAGLGANACSQVLGQLEAKQLIRPRGPGYDLAPGVNVWFRQIQEDTARAQRAIVPVGPPQVKDRISFVGQPEDIKATGGFPAARAKVKLGITGTTEEFHPTAIVAGLSDMLGAPEHGITIINIHSEGLNIRVEVEMPKEAARRLYDSMSKDKRQPDPKEAVKTPPPQKSYQTLVGLFVAANVPMAVLAVLFLATGWLGSGSSGHAIINIIALLALAGSLIFLVLYLNEVIYRKDRDFWWSALAAGALAAFGLSVLQLQVGWTTMLPGVLITVFMGSMTLTLFFLWAPHPGEPESKWAVTPMIIMFLATIAGILWSFQRREAILVVGPLFALFLEGLLLMLFFRSGGEKEA